MRSPPKQRFMPGDCLQRWNACRYTDANGYASTCKYHELYDVRHVDGTSFFNLLSTVFALYSLRHHEIYLRL